MNRKTKDMILTLERKLFRGRLVAVYSYLKEHKKRAFFGRGNAVNIDEPVSDMILMQFNQTDFMQYQFADLAVRYLAVENYYNKNDYGFELYRKMHTLGENYGQNNDAEVYYQKLQKRGKHPKFGVEKEEHSIEQFQALIKSYEQRGYDPTSAIISDRNLLSLNGSHRITLATYFEQEFMNVQVQNSVMKRRFSMDWFWQKGFTRDEIKVIGQTLDKLIKDAKDRTGEYYCILYPPACAYFDEITEDIGSIDEENIKVTGWQDYRVAVEDFVGMLKVMYFFDSIRPENLERKIKCILNASEIVNNRVRYRVVSLDIKKPMYRLKTDNGMPEAVATVRLKEIIRERFRVRDDKFTKHFQGGYAHDVIIHSTDNFLSNKAFRLLSKVDKNIELLFEQLREFRYCIIERGSGKLSEDFPKNFYFNEDIDILVKQSELEKIVEKTVDFCKAHFASDWITVDSEESRYGKRVWVRLRGCMLIMFDFMIEVPEICQEYVKECLERREGTAYYYLSLEDEVHFRLAKYLSNPNKVWHAKYIKEKVDLFDFNERVFDNSKKAKKIYLQIINGEEGD